MIIALKLVIFFNSSHLPKQRAEMADVDSQLSLKLLIDTRSNKVIFGEARKDFVDFMFSLLTLPLSAVIKLLSPPNMAGGIGHLYQSIENLDETYFLKNRDKSSLLEPKVPIFDASSPLLLKIETDKFPSGDGRSSPSPFAPASSPSFGSVFNSYSSSPMFHFSSSGSMFNSSCSSPMFHFSSSSSMFNSSSYGSIFNSSSSSSARGGNEGALSRGFVKEVITYMIKDDLEVTPMSAISSIALINRFNMKNAQLEEKVVVVGKKEGIALLKASLESVTVLTDVFCPSAKKINDPSHLTVNLEEL